MIRKYLYCVARGLSSIIGVVRYSLSGTRAKFRLVRLINDGSGGEGGVRRKGLKYVPCSLPLGCQITARGVGFSVFNQPADLSHQGYRH